MYGTCMELVWAGMEKYKTIHFMSCMECMERMGQCMEQKCFKDDSRPLSAHHIEAARTAIYQETVPPPPLPPSRKASYKFLL